MIGATRRHRAAGRGSRTASTVALYWLRVVAGSSRLWRPGEVISRGEFVGNTTGGLPVHATGAGRVTAIQYDVETDEVILAVGPIVGGKGASRV